MTKKYYRLNQYIVANEVRVVDEEGKQIGILPLQEALKGAKEKNLDLVEIAAKAQPPVCKIIDFKKFLYLETRKRQEEKRKSKKSELKEIRLAPFIADNDLNFRLKRAQEFLKNDDKVKFTVRFRGREIARKEFGYELLKKVIGKLTPYAEIESEPKLLGRQLEMVFQPLKRGKNEKKETKN